MKKIDLLQLKKIQLQILDVVTNYCEKNGIQYWLDCGTLLGAIRHNGYIPWDDDIDIGMLRPDFDRFLHEFNGVNERYQVKCIDNDPDFCYVMAKVLDTHTVLFEPDEKGLKLSVNIDIFPYDNAPENQKDLKRMYDCRDFLRNCNQLRTMSNEPTGSMVRRILVKFLRFCVKPFPHNYFAKKESENAKRYSLIETGKIGNFTGYTRVSFDKTLFNTFEKHIFEGRQYKILTEYDQWLKAFYGEYMKLPPKEERLSHHRFLAYFVDNQ